MTFERKKGIKPFRLFETYLLSFPSLYIYSKMNRDINSSGAVTISGVVILQSPRAIDPQKGPRNIVFDANFYVVEGSESVTMGLLRYFASNEMATDIQKMAEKAFQKAFVVANVCDHFFLQNNAVLILIHIQIASLTTPNSITSLMSDFEPSDYAFIGDIYQVRHLNT